MRYRGSGSNISKQTSSDVGNEDWETTSENSEDHVEDHKESRNNRNKQFSVRGNTGSNQNVASNIHSRRNEQAGNNREKNVKSSNTASSRAPGAEKRNLQNSSFAGQKNHSSSIPPLIQATQVQNGRSRNQTSGGNSTSSGKSITKDSTVNRMDEIKLTDSNLVNQALNDINKRSQGKEKKAIIDCEMETSNCTEDGPSIVEDKVDSDGFQEVRSKKNVKESRHGQKEETKPLKLSLIHI